MGFNTIPVRPLVNAAQSGIDLGQELPFAISGAQLHRGVRFERSAVGFDCGRSQDYPAGTDCKSLTDCAPGRLCVQLGKSPDIFKCSLWCDAPATYASSCPGAASYCSAFEPPAYFASKEYGTCVAP